ncbi:hypothetical protein TNCT_634101 [Trichonephila clavata]|uniref:Uncharacterized protein n=1 Tax=Trichonephila clavata TaxID=2740835 RepID=A0A8X6KTB1_TRICU|nr:hypothetical protein TNCT_634101 [Trichonephila clavata]
MTSVYFPFCLLVFIAMVTLLCKAESKSASQSNSVPLARGYDLCKSKADAVGSLLKVEKVKINACFVKCKFSFGDGTVLRLPKDTPCSDYGTKITGVCDEDGKCRPVGV